jgi:eukaryotic-like serine/threonine-protein kinase
MILESSFSKEYLSSWNGLRTSRVLLKSVAFDGITDYPKLLISIVTGGYHSVVAIGAMVQHYKVLGPLGKGGMGEVFLAQDTVLDRKVALKFLPDSMQQDASARKRFVREAKSAAALDHPFICKIYDVGEADGRAFMAMEYIAGETLRSRLNRGPLPLRETLQMACEIAEALEEAHEKRIVHRDLKPSNIMLTLKGHTKIMDFGLAKQLVPEVDSDVEATMTDAERTRTATEGLTKEGMVVGTIDYMSPEQARGEPVDARSDIFSFGVVLYEMLSGKNPFHRQSQIETLSAILRDGPPKLQVQDAAAHSRLRSISSKALAKDASARYQSIKDMAADLHTLRDELLPRKRPAWMIWTLAASGLLVVLLAWLWWQKPQAPPPAQQPVSILIADFENRTGETVFDAVLEKALEVGMEGASFITCYKRTKAREVAQTIKKGLETDRLDRERALLVAQREGINVVLSGSISGSGGGYQIDIEALDPFSSKRTDARDVRVKSKDDVLGEMAKLAVKIREGLGDKKAGSVPLNANETFTSSSLEAARSYAVGQELQTSGKYAQALDAYSRAIQLDSNFGRAYAGLAASSFNLKRKEDADKYYVEAMQRIDRMTEREKLRTLGGYYLNKGNNQKAIDEYSKLIKQYPADEAGLTNLAFAYLFAHDAAGAFENGRKAVAIYPKNILSRGNLALYAMYAGEFDTALAEAKKVVEMNAGYETAYVCQAVCETVKNNLPQAKTIYQKLAGVSPVGATLSAMGLADLDLFEGKLAEGIELLDKGIASDLASKDTNAAARKMAALAWARIRQNKLADAISAAASAAKTGKEERVLFEAANAYADAGRIPEALDLAQTLDARIEPDPQAYARIIQARVKLSQGDKKGARSDLEEMQKRIDTWLLRFELGRVYLESGAFTEAYTQFEQCLKRRGEATAVFLDDIPTLRYLPSVYYYLGRAQEGLGSPAAAESYRTFLAIKEKGTEDPLVTDARRRLGLQPSGASR